MPPDDRGDDVIYLHVHNYSNASAAHSSPLTRHTPQASPPASSLAPLATTRAPHTPAETGSLVAETGSAAGSAPGPAEQRGCL